MGIQLNGNNDNISAVDGDLSITGIVTFSQLDVGNNIKLGNAGVITATSFSGDGSNLTGITGVTINGNVDNRLVTATGTTGTLNGESGLTYNGSTLGLSGSLAITGGKVGINATSPTRNLQIGDGTVDSNNVLRFGKRVASNEGNLPLIGHHSHNGSSSSLALSATSSSGCIHFFTGNDADGFGDGSNEERLRIDSNGNLTLLTTDAKIQLKDGNNYIQFVNADKNFKFMNAWGAGEFTFHVNGGERLRIDSSGAIVIPDGTDGLRFGSATNQDFALFHSGSNSHIEHFGTGNLLMDFNNDFTLRFFRSAGDVREALTVTNGVAANPEFTIKSNPTSASVNSGTHAPLVKFKGAGWNTSSGSVEVGTQLQSEHYYWTGSYSNTFGQTYPDFKIKMKNSDSASYVEKFAFSGNGVMRLQSGGGINFHNYGGGGGVVSNTLDDYEEGSWSPTYTSQGGSAGSVSYSNQMGYYVKIGHTVWVWIELTISSASGMTGNAAIGNHPFNNNARGSGGNYYYSGTSNWYIENHAENKPIFTGWMPGSSNIFIIHNGTHWGSLPYGPLNTTGRLSFSHCYTTNS